MYSDAIQMCAENKINEKNTWALDLIDHMGRMIEQPSAAGNDAAMTNFQFASSTLDAGVKIYAYRVDSVYNETYKLIGGLNRAKGDEVADGALDTDSVADAGAPEGPGTKEARKPRRAKPPSSNLEANPASLDLKKLEMSFEVDPLFHRTSAKFDEGGAKGLLLVNLAVRPGCALSFDSSGTCAADPAVGAPPPVRVPLAPLAALVPKQLSEKHVCAELCGMVGSLRTGVTCTADAEPELATAVSDEDDSDGDAAAGGGYDDDNDELGTADLGADAFDASADLGGEPEPLDAAEAAREAAFLRQLSTDGEGETAVAAAFMSLDEPVAESHPTERGTEAEEGTGVADTEAAARERVQRLLQVGQRWAGPAHWKFGKPAGSGGGGGGGTAAAAPPKRGKGKAPFAIDFGRSTEVLASLRAMETQAKGTTLTEAALAKDGGSCSTLPPDLNCTPEVLSCLFHKPETRLSRRRRLQPSASVAKAAEGGDAGGAADYESDGDDWAPADGGEVEDETSVDEGAHADALVSGAPVAAPLQLVAEPQKVAQIKIGYAKVAKQVDIKGLKAGVWELLQDVDGEARKAGAVQVSFQEVLQQLPSKVEPSQLPDVSFAYCFISLLHLANERGLEIADDKDRLSDLRVTMPR
mmetsp:Transcript_46350/g.154665  ORF Transcript_46350/g.154665 Transcript_46350/m.154665 type:complete len:640 (+) Transcript_46350:256-2175(+)